MTLLRQQMIAAMSQRGFSDRTHRSYLIAVQELARYHHRSPDRLRKEELQRFFNYLAQERKLSGASCRLYLHGIRFLYTQVLNWPTLDVELIIPKRAQRIPELLTRAEVTRIIAVCTNIKHRTLLQVTYGCGLRVSEVVSLKVRDIDSERHLLRITQGKGAKDRMVVLSPSLLTELRCYWQLCRPANELFPHPHTPHQSLSISTAQKVYGKAKARSGVDKKGGIHSLRHAYATHQLEHGLPVHLLQRQLGHRNLQSTLRYIHWVPTQQGLHCEHTDLIAGQRRAS